jgi:integrase
MNYRITEVNGKKVAIISYKDAAGVNKQKWLTKRKYEAEQQLKRRCDDWIYLYESKDINNNEKITFGNYLTQWIETRRKIAETTADGYRIYINKHIIPALGHIRLVKLKASDIDKFYAKLTDSTYTKGGEIIPYSQNTLLQIHAIIHKALDYARRNKLIPDNPSDSCDNKPVHERYQGTVYNEAQFAKLMDAVKGTVDEICIILAGCLGLRRGEVLGLKWENIDYKDMNIQIRKTRVRTKNGIIEKPPKNNRYIL